jgi:hypothetical protein
MLKVGQRVKFNPGLFDLSPRHHGKRATVVAIDGDVITVKKDGCKRNQKWHYSCWTPVRRS